MYGSPHPRRVTSLDDVASYYRQAGYRVETRPLLGEADQRFRPELTAQRPDERRAVRWSQTPIEAADASAFARAARDFAFIPVVIAPYDEMVAAVCTADDVEFMDVSALEPSEFLSRFSAQPSTGGLTGTVYPTLAAPDPDYAPTPSSTSARARRWFIVGTIWLIALMLVAGFLLRAM